MKMDKNTEVCSSAENQDAEERKMEQEDGRDRKRSLFKEIVSYVKIIVIACIVGLLANRFILINALIPSESMENLLMVDDRIFGCRLSYVFNEPERYDVVMFKYPVHEETIYIKRVIGLPGETVEIKDAKIYINGSKKPLEEDYLPEKWVARNDGYTFKVPQDCFFMMGDNRNISEDARDWAQCAIDDGVASDEKKAQAYTFVHEDKIIGRAILKYYPKFQIL